jgi:uncharacterized protein YrzB (UPF0473 family)
MSSSAYPDDRSREESDIVTLNDEVGRSLPCSVERYFEIDRDTYVLLLPVDTPIEIFAWSEGEDDDSDEDVAEVVPIEEDAEINEIFADASAVLAEQNLSLKRSAFVLSVSGEIPPLIPDDIIPIEVSDEPDDEPEEYQILATFYHEEQEYAICTPVDPLLFFGRQNPRGEVTLLSPEEAESLEPMLQELLIDDDL